VLAALDLGFLAGLVLVALLTALIRALDIPLVIHASRRCSGTARVRVLPAFHLSFLAWLIVAAIITLICHRSAPGYAGIALRTDT
jgi:hypothetical protein